MRAERPNHNQEWCLRNSTYATLIQRKERAGKMDQNCSQVPVGGRADAGAYPLDAG